MHAQSVHTHSLCLHSLSLLFEQPATASARAPTNTSSFIIVFLLMHYDTKSLDEIQVDLWYKNLTIDGGYYGNSTYT